MEIIQQDYNTENRKIEDQIAVQICPPADSNFNDTAENMTTGGRMRAEPEQPSKTKGFVLYKIAHVFTKQRVY